LEYFPNTPFPNMPQGDSCLGENFADMEEFGKEREERLRDFLKLPNGIPDSDTFRRQDDTSERQRQT
jgi:hypothetical protein